MSISCSLHSKNGWSAKSKQRGTTIWIEVTDDEDNSIAFFFTDADLATRVADAFNYRTITKNGEPDGHLD